MCSRSAQLLPSLHFQTLHSDMTEQLKPESVAVATAHGVLWLVADAWPLLSAGGRARVDAVLDNHGALAIMVRHA